jgi:hypothetical protein
MFQFVCFSSFRLVYFYLSYFSNKFEGEKIHKIVSSPCEQRWHLKGIVSRKFDMILFVLLDR